MSENQDNKFEDKIKDDVNLTDMLTKAWDTKHFGYELHNDLRVGPKELMTCLPQLSQFQTLFK